MVILYKKVFIIILLKKDVVPHGVPEPIPPVPDKLDLPRLEADIPKFLENSRAFGGR